MDLIKESFTGVAFDKLITTITGKNKINTPKSVTRASIPKPSISKGMDDTAEIRILNIIKEDIPLPRNDGTRGSGLYAIPFLLSDYPSRRWIDLFIQAWNYPSHFSTMHRPGIAKVSGNRIILDGTTIDEYKQFHHETLQGAIAEANRKEQEWREAQKVAEEHRAEKERQFRSDIDTQLEDVSF